MRGKWLSQNSDTIIKKSNISATEKFTKHLKIFKTINKKSLKYETKMCIVAPLFFEPREH